jgi:hypothetical protein
MHSASEDTAIATFANEVFGIFLVVHLVQVIGWTSAMLGE